MSIQAQIAQILNNARIMPEFVPEPIALLAPKPRPRSGSVGCTVDGVRYETLTLAGKAHGINRALVVNRCQAIRWPTWVADHIEKRRGRNPGTPKKPVRINGVRYASMTEAGRCLNMRTCAVHFRVNSDLHPDWTIC